VSGRSGAVPGLSGSDWAGEGAERWSAEADRLEAMLAPVDDEALLPAAALTAGERVLDVGCGRGVTTRTAAVLTGPSGAVTGVDIAARLIEEATLVPVPAGSSPVSWVTADAATHPFPGGGFDVVVSRLGAIFFDDPVAAFANLQRATRPGGRLAVAVWLPRDASEFQSLAVDVAVRVAADRGDELQPPGPDAGPFAYGVADHTRPILEAAGWRDVSLTRHDLMLYLGGAGTTPEEAVEMGRRFGPLAMVLDGAPPEVVDPVLAELVEELHRRWDGTGIPLQAAIAVVSARR
jgi:SAM-dependent methyltransferase